MAVNRGCKTISQEQSYSPPVKYMATDGTHTSTSRPYIAQVQDRCSAYGTRNIAMSTLKSEDAQGGVG